MDEKNGPISVLLLNLPSFSKRKYCREIMGGFGLEVGDSLRYPPLPLAYRAAILEREGIPVGLLDAEALELDAEAILDRIREGGYDLVGIISSLVTLTSDMAFTDRLKAALPGTKVFFTGPVIHLYRDRILSSSSCDFTVNAKNDDKPVDLVRALEAGDPAVCMGISWKRDGEVIHNPDEDRVFPMEELPLPARHLMPNERYHIAGMRGPVTTVQTARGCPYRCDICAYRFSQGHVYRTRPLDHVLDELTEIRDRYGIRNVVFRDITFTVNRKRVLELCRRMIDAKLDITWWAETTPNLVDDELLEAMAAAGMDALSLGVEAGGAEALKTHWVQKSPGFDQVRSVFDTCRRLGVKTRGYFVIGFPGETEECYRETLKWARALRPTTLQFLPYRELPADPETYTQVDPDVLKRIKKAYLSYYLTPRNLVRQLFSPGSFLNRIRRFLSLGDS